MKIQRDVTPIKGSTVNPSKTFIYLASSSKDGLLLVDQNQTSNPKNYRNSIANTTNNLSLSHRTNNSLTKKLPKNVNEYRHIIDTVLSRDSDVEWVLSLKSYMKFGEYSPLRERPIQQPPFYDEDFQRYKTKVDEDLSSKKLNKLRLMGNSRDFEHVMNNRLNMPANPSQLGFDSTLRKFTPFESTHGPNVEWKTLAKSPKKNLLDKYLPPLKASSLKNLSKMGEYVCRPYATKLNVK